MSEILDDPIAKTEQLFRKLDADLDEISRRLESNSTNKCKVLSNNQFSGISLALLLAKLQQIKIDYKEIVEEISKIEAEEREAVEFFRFSAASVVDSFSLLSAESEVNQDLSSVIDEAKQFSALFDNNLRNSGSTNTVASTLTEGDENASLKGILKQNGVKAAGPDKENYKVGGFIPIQERTFLMVSALVRGKVKLVDVNTTYEKLWRYFKEEKNTKPLTPVDMDKMGFRVAGKTGMAKLKVLQSLKLIQMTPKGDVKNLL